MNGPTSPNFQIIIHEFNAGEEEFGNYLRRIGYRLLEGSDFSKQVPAGMGAVLPPGAHVYSSLAPSHAACICLLEQSLLCSAASDEALLAALTPFDGNLVWLRHRTAIDAAAARRVNLGAGGADTGSRADARTLGKWPDRLRSDLIAATVARRRLEELLHRARLRWKDVFTDDLMSKPWPSDWLVDQTSEQPGCVCGSIGLYENGDFSRAQHALKSLATTMMPGSSTHRDGRGNIPSLILKVSAPGEIIFDNLRWHFSLGIRDFLIVDAIRTQGSDAVDRFALFSRPHGARIERCEIADLASGTNEELAARAADAFGTGWILMVAQGEFVDLGGRSLKNAFDLATVHVSKAMGVRPESPLFAAGIRFPVHRFVATSEDDWTESSVGRRMIYRDRKAAETALFAWWNGADPVLAVEPIPTLNGGTYRFRIRAYDCAAGPVSAGGLAFDPLPDLSDGSPETAPSPFPFRFKTMAVTRTKIERLVVEGHVAEPYSVSFMIPGASAPVELRFGTSDLPTFYQVFTRKDYEFSLPYQPDVIFDLGANIGLASLYFHTQYPEATIVAVEPNPENFRMLQRNVMGADRVKLVHGAIWHESGELDLVDTSETGSPLGFWGMQTRSPGQEGRGGFRVAGLTIDQLMKRFGVDRIDLLKVDIEGAELELFSFGVDRWLSSVRTIAVETHDRFRPGSERAVRQALTSSEFYETRKGENLIFTRIEPLVSNQV